MATFLFIIMIVFATVKNVAIFWVHLNNQISINALRAFANIVHIHLRPGQRRWNRSTVSMLISSDAGSW